MRELKLGTAGVVVRKMESLSAEKGSLFEGSGVSGESSLLLIELTSSR